MGRPEEGRRELGRRVLSSRAHVLAAAMRSFAFRRHGMNGTARKLPTSLRVACNELWVQLCTMQSEDTILERSANHWFVSDGSHVHFVL